MDTRVNFKHKTEVVICEGIISGTLHQILEGLKALFGHEFYSDLDATDFLRSNRHILKITLLSSGPPKRIFPPKTQNGTITIGTFFITVEVYIVCVIVK